MSWSKGIEGEIYASHHVTFLEDCAVKIGHDKVGPVDADFRQKTRHWDRNETIGGLAADTDISIDDSIEDCFVLSYQTKRWLVFG